MADRYEQDIERRQDRDREYDRGNERQDRGFDRGLERSSERGYGGQQYSGNQGAYRQSGQGGYEGGYNREQPQGNEQDWRSENRGRSSATTYETEADRLRRNQGDRGYSGQSGWGGGMGAYSGGGAYGGSWTGGMGTYGQQSQTGRHTGRGPKNYKRSDERIREDINDQLTQHPDIDAFEIEVQVNQGEVTLRGSVGNRHEKRLAEDIAENVPGIVDVRNELRVQQTGQSPSPATGTTSSGSTSGSSKTSQKTT